MSQPNVARNVWFRRIHDTWSNDCGWRTDIPQSVLDDASIKQAAFVLDDERALFIDMAELRSAIAGCPRRENGVVGPFNVDPRCSTLNGRRVSIEVRLPKTQSA
jgi:hypothetical protein